MSRFAIWDKVKRFTIPWVKQPIHNPQKDDQQHVMTEDELLDQTLEDSFPASDPPGHISKSSEDRIQH